MPSSPATTINPNQKLLLFGEQDHAHGAIEVDSFPLNLDATTCDKTFTFRPEIAREVVGFTHGIHVYPAKFIPQIPRWSFRLASLRPGARVLDPFCGSGTTLVEGFLQNYVCFGTDINPLARLLTKVKTTPLYTANQRILLEQIRRLVNDCRTIKGHIDINCTPMELNLHSNWRYWFPDKLMVDILRIKQNILSFDGRINKKANGDLRDFFLVVFSSIIKKASLFDERQIKVRLRKDKFKDGLPNVLNIFESALVKATSGLAEFTRRAESLTAADATVIGTHSHKLPLESRSIDHIVTSPPYLNAIDYPMAHKYSLFLLDLISPNNFFEHCREYVGVTERAVRKEHLSTIATVGVKKIDALVNALQHSDNVVDQVRAYIIYRYFHDMWQSLKEFHRVLRHDAYCIIVVGDNNIRGRYVPTHLYIKELAELVGFKCCGTFFHQLRNIRLKINRNVTGGKINKEMVLILRK